MKLQAIGGLSESAKIEYRKIVADLKEKYGSGKFNSFNCNQIFDEYEYQSKHARAVHKGKLKEGMTLTELEVSMICDNGFSHFGGSSTIYKDGTFQVDIYTD